MLFYVSNEEVALIERTRNELTEALVNADMDKAKFLDAQLSNMCVSAIEAELDKANRINSH